ncbi:MAG TPA: flagellar hook protein FlgE [candidate division Zixibacteria bacterium]|nr:flagellar hook protein FlgE [candidate division Zixibacteria bacterium]
MTIPGSMFTAITALSAFGDWLAVAGNNIANLNTAGFRASRAQFEDLLPSVSGSVETGHGVRLGHVSKPFRQGALETTGTTTDLAIAGNGFFTVRDPLSGASYYTRAGQFRPDADGRLVNADGMVLQGVGGDIVLSGATTLPGQATSRLALQFNLDPAATMPGTPFPSGPDASPASWLAASNFSAVTTIYDGLGKAHELTIVFRRETPSSWEYRVLAPRRDLDTAAPSSTELRQAGAPGLLRFDSSGQLDAAASTITDITGLNWVGGGAQTLSAGALDFSGTTQLAGPSALLAAVQDGSAPGALIGVQIDAQGLVSGRYSNGARQVLGALVLADFANVDDLEPIGETLFAPTARSGAARTGAPGQGGFGDIVSGALEQSGVDLAMEFVSLIGSQRAFQVNSRILTTADQMYAEAARLKE